MKAMKPYGQISNDNNKKEENGESRRLADDRGKWSM